MTKHRLIDKYFPVLDHGFIALVDYMGSDSDLSSAARVSYGKGTEKKREDYGLIRYLIRKRHTSPIEMAELKFHAAMPIFVARQWVRHRTASLNEYSGRYSEVPDTYYVPEGERVRGQSETNKQGSSDELVGLSTEKRKHYFDGRATVAFDDYAELLEHGVSRELSRIVLPLSTYTQWYWKIDLHNLLHFLFLRMDSHAQWEIQQYANVIASIVQELFPHTFQAFLDYQVNSVTFSFIERKILHKKLLGTYGSHDDIPEYNLLSSGEKRDFDDKLSSLTAEISAPEVDIFSAMTPEQAYTRFFGGEE